VTEGAPDPEVAPADPMPRGLVVVLGLTGLLVSTLALQQFSSILAPVLLALVLVIGVHPLTGFLRRHGFPQWLAATITLITVLAIIIGLAASLALSVARLSTTLPQYQASFAALLNELKGVLASLGVGREQVQNLVAQIDFGKVAGLLTQLLAGLAGAFTNLLFLIFVVLFMGVDAVAFSHRLESVGIRRTAVVTALGGFVRGTRSYLFVSTIFGLIVAAIDAAFLGIVGVPLALLWGLLAFVTNYIPNIGFIIGLVPPALLALLEGGPRLMITVIVAYAVINFVIQSVIQPKFVGDAVNLSLTLTFLSLVFWSFVIGPLGAVLAIPLTLLSKALLLDVDPRTQWISALLSGGQGERHADPGADHADEPVVEHAAEPVADPATHEVAEQPGRADQGTPAGRLATEPPSRGAER
jgi:AI-2 transport protein TqsA